MDIKVKEKDFLTEYRGSDAEGRLNLIQDTISIYGAKK